jgi:murein L,D-transpeptidase YafK
MLNARLAFVLATGFTLSSGCSTAPASAITTPKASEAPPARPVPLSRIVDSLHIKPAELWLEVDKSERVFRVMHDSTELKQYVCVLGENPVGDKRMQGDRRTPEGTFTFRSKRRPHQWHVFIWIDYPNAESRRRFQERKRKGEIPANADIGGEVGIHGVPEGKDAWIVSGQDWTWGCIALTNADVDEIYPYIQPMRTIIRIIP